MTKFDEIRCQMWYRGKPGKLKTNHFEKNKIQINIWWSQNLVLISQTATCCLEINLFIIRPIIYIYIFWRLNIFWNFSENELRFFRCLITRSPGTLVNNIFRPRPIPVKLFSTKFINYLSQTRHHSVFTWFSRFFLKTRQRINTEKLADAEFFDKNWKKITFLRLANW